MTTSQNTVRKLERFQLSPPEDMTYRIEDWNLLARYWHPVAWSSEVQDKPLAVTLLDVQLVIFRTNDGISIGRDFCPHRGVPLSKGCIMDQELVCPYHGMRFASDGSCKKIPAHPQQMPSERFNLRTFPVIERHGLVWTCLTPGAEDSIPPMPEWEDASYERIQPPHVDMAGSAGRQVEGFIDVAHFAFVHDKAFADAENQVVPLYSTEITPSGVRSDYVSNVSNYPKPLQHLAPPDFDWHRVYEVFPPYVAKLTVHFPEGKRYVIMNAPSPVSARKLRLFVPIVRNFDELGSVDSVLAFNAQVFAEDQVMVESQKPISLQQAESEEAHFPADRTSVSYRKLLKEIGLSRA